MSASLTIGDFARATHLSVKTLRHDHRVGVLDPAGVDPDTGYRSYTTDQIPVAQVVRRFRDLDMPLDDIQSVLTAPDLETRNAVISAHLGAPRRSARRSRSRRRRRGTRARSGSCTPRSRRRESRPPGRRGASTQASCSPTTAGKPRSSFRAILLFAQPGEWMPSSFQPPSWPRLSMPAPTPTSTSRTERSRHTWPTTPWESMAQSVSTTWSTATTPQTTPNGAPRSDGPSFTPARPPNHHPDGADVARLVRAVTEGGPSRATAVVSPLVGRRSEARGSLLATGSTPSRRTSRSMNAGCSFWRLPISSVVCNYRGGRGFGL
jgi:DNA-binding transcriptional MerR regulator